MDRRALATIAFILVLLMGIVATAGLDNLPKDLRAAVVTASKQVEADRVQVQQRRASVNRALLAEPVLFRTKETVWRDKLTSDEMCVAREATLLQPLEQLAKENRRTDRDKVQKGLSDLDQARARCGKDSAAVDEEAQRWLKYKRELPARLAAFQQSHDAIAAFNVETAAASVAKAKLDWPAKQQDLDRRLAELKEIQANGERLWTSTEALRAAATRNDVQNFDYGTFFDKAEAMDQSARNLKDGAAGLTQMAAQLYTGWDKLLLEVDDNRERVRLVKTKFPDSTLANGVTTSEERWEPLSGVRPQDAAKNTEMVIAHKAAGKYDSEVENRVQPPAYAYIAPPGQANAYGAWNNGVWSWLPQYLILSQLLNASRNSIDMSEYNSWQRARDRGEVYYGRYRTAPTEYRSRSYRPGLLRGALEAIILSRSAGSSGSGGWNRERPSSYGSSRPAEGWYKERPKPTWGSSGYGGSRYQSRGSFSGSRYQSRGTFGSGSSFSRGFGRGRR